MGVENLAGDCRAVMPTLVAGSVQCCVTSPPYYGLKNYEVDGQIGLEGSPEEYVAELVAVFREVRRILRDDGTLWLNIGDSYAGYHGNKNHEIPTSSTNGWNNGYNENLRPSPIGKNGIKQKDLLGIPWRVALALQADGWYLRSAVVWHKPNPAPERVRDRPTSTYEMVFLFAKKPRYFYDASAIAEPTRNAPNVWVISPATYRGAHFATMPPELAERCIKAGSRVGDTVLDPFGGAGTTALVADQLGRDVVSIELNPAYCELARERIMGNAPLFAAAE